MTTTAAVADRVATVCPAFAPDKVPAAQEAPYGIVYGGTRTPQDRGLTGDAWQAAAVWRIVTVSNNEWGATTLANRVVTVLDGWRDGGRMFHVEAVSAALRDDSDPTNVSWSSTIELWQYQ